MQWRGDGWWLATLAAVGAGACFAVAIWAGAGHFDRSAKPSSAIGALTERAVPAPIFASGFERDGYPDGTCLGFVDGRPASEVFRTSCDEGHVYEVTGTLDLERLGDESYPSVATWTAVQDTCVAVGEQYFGAPIGTNREPRLVAGLIRIPEPSWVGGARHTPCVLVEVDATGNMVTRTARLRP